jgi:endonuclease/exonuclease/phosphatase family metal-dependent hydrolase
VNRIGRSTLAAAVLMAVAGCVSANLDPRPEVFSRDTGYRVVAATDTVPQLKVMTVNLAHGRGTGLHQALQDAADARRNLDAVDALIERESPDVVALQEADAPSVWSGRFDHVDYLARGSGYGWGVHATHAIGGGLAYGTAVLSRLSVADSAAVTFTPAAATLPKGFSVATVRWPEAGIDLDVVSVHLEPLRGSVRRKQAEQMVAVLADRGRPLVIMGDFNTDWGGKDGVLQTVSEALDVTAYSPGGDGIVTYPRLGRRLDWILISEPLRFASFRVFEDPVSDHRAVAAEINLRPSRIDRLARASRVPVDAADAGTP